MRAQASGADAVADADAVSSRTRSKAGKLGQCRATEVDATATDSNADTLAAALAAAEKQSVAAIELHFALHLKTAVFDRNHASCQSQP